MAKTVEKKKKLNIVRLFLVILILYLVGSLIFNILNSNVKNIYVINNKLVSDWEIIELAGLDNYPSLLFTSSKNMKEKIETNKLISDVKITKKLDRSITLDITEYQALFYDELDKVTVLSNGEKISQNNIYNLPILINNVPKDTYDSLIKKFIQIDLEIKEKISEIKYYPNEVDDERFILTMKDGNYVYITLTKIKNINKYNEILPSLENKKGILYLDSGQYFEIFKDN